MGWVATGFEFESGGLGNVCCCDGGWGDKTKDTLAVVGRLGEPGRIWEMGSPEKIKVFGAEGRGLGEHGKWCQLKEHKVFGAEGRGLGELGNIWEMGSAEKN